MNNRLSAAASVWRLFAEEWRAIFTNRTIRSVMIVVPLVYVTLFGFLYSEKKVMEIPTVLVDQDQTELSRELARAFDYDQTFAVTSVVGSEQEAVSAVERGDAYVAVLIPDGLEERVKHGEEANVLTIVDGSNMLISNAAVRAANTVVKSISAGVTLKKLEARGQWGDEGKNLFTGIDYRYRVLFNPAFNYQTFMVLGLTGTVLQQVLFLGVALAVAREKEAGTWADMRSRYGFWTILAGKLTPYLLVATFNLLVTFAILLRGFGVPMYGRPALLLAAGTVFHLAVLAVGFAISMCFSSQLQATQVAMIIAVPSFMLSGFTWPLMSMPAVVAGIGKALPLTYFLHAAREVVNKGHGLAYIWHDLGVLGFIALIGLFVSYVGYQIPRARARTHGAEPVALDRA